MDINDKIDIELSTILEGLEDKMPHLVSQLLSKKSRWIGKRIKNNEDRNVAAEKAIRSISNYDPTPNEKFINFLVGQVKNGGIVEKMFEEDGPKIKAALEVFANKKRGWPGENDLMAYKNYRDLLQDASKYNEMLEQNPDVTKSGKDRDKERRAIESKLRENAKVVVDNGSDIVYEITDKETIALFGRGTEWCTSASPMRNVSKFDKKEDIFNAFKRYFDAGDSFDAENNSLSFWPGGLEQVKSDIENSDETGKIPNNYYIGVMGTCGGYLRGGPFYVFYRDGEPYMQIASDQIMNVNDHSALKVGKQTAQALIALVKTGKLNDNTKNLIIRLLQNSRKKKMATA